MSNNDLQEIKKGIDTLNKNLEQILNSLSAKEIEASINEMKKCCYALKESIERKIDQIEKNESAILNQIAKTIEKQNEERNKLNRLIVKFFIPIASGLMFLLVFIYSLRDKSIESVLLSLSILGIGAVSVIGLVVALAIINKRED